jgi:hypothetical protein
MVPLMTHRFPTRLISTAAILTVVAAIATSSGTIAAARPLSSAAASAADLGVAAPTRGMGVAASALMADGSEVVQHAERSASGQLHVWTGGAVDGGALVPLAPAGGLSPCRDAKYNLTGKHWNKAYHWQFRAASTPRSIPQSRVLAALRRAASNITGAHNDCALPDRVSARHRYDGVTARRPNVGNGVCLGQPDGHNVIGFRDLPTGVVALSCWWYFIGSPITLEADMALNKVDYTWQPALRGRCVNRYVVVAVATHEFGHIFGLGHVSELQHPDLTMSTQGYPCDNAPSTLGLGDVRGLERLY